MGRAGDKITPAIAQRGKRLWYWKDKLDLGIDALFLEIAKLDRSNCREVGIGNQIGQGNFIGHEKLLSV